MSIPNHVAIIMDGNRRWAKNKGKVGSYGHKVGMDTLVNLAEYIFKTEVKVLSVYAFSTENFKRSKEEVDYLMNLFTNNFEKALKNLLKNNIRIVFSGRKENLSEEVIKAIEDLENKTKNNNAAIFNVCLNYGGRAEIIDVSKKFVENNINSEDINEEIFSKYLYNEIPDVDLLIRTGGEMRLSNFLLWQNSYAEIYFTDVLFPDFNELEFDKALYEYNHRNRRFGGNS